MLRALHFEPWGAEFRVLCLSTFFRLAVKVGRIHVVEGRYQELGV